MCTETAGRKIIPDLPQEHRFGYPPIYVSMPSDLRDLRWRGVSLETLTRKLLGEVLSFGHPARSVRLAVREKRKLSDLDDFFAMSPLSWLQLSAECQSESGLKEGAQRVLEALGCRCPEWVTVEGSGSQLGAFYLETQETPAIILHIQDRGARRTCDLLIPVF